MGSSGESLPLCVWASLLLINADFLSYFWLCLNITAAFGRTEQLPSPDLSVSSFVLGRYLVSSCVPMDLCAWPAFTVGWMKV